VSPLSPEVNIYYVNTHSPSLVFTGLHITAMLVAHVQLLFGPSKELVLTSDTLAHWVMGSPGPPSPIKLLSSGSCVLWWVGLNLDGDSHPLLLTTVLSHQREPPNHLQTTATVKTNLTSRPPCLSTLACALLLEIKNDPNTYSREELET
jgi:hypothetical protein